MKKVFKNSLWLFTICMAVVLVFSLFANMANTSFYQVDVKKINFDTENNEGNIEGLLYTPNSCDADNPCPVIVTTHGYLNSKEMQDAPSIELSRRGYIVLAIDMYDHGGSTWETPAAFSFYADSIWDAVKYVYDQDYTLKDSNGNGMIAVSGHSMGGFSSEMAVLRDESAFAVQGHRKIAVSLSVGADYRYTYFYAGSDEAFMDKFSTRSSGMIIAHYDEFFGDDGARGDNTVSYKNYIETDQGKYFLGDSTNLEADEEYEMGKFYDFAGGQRVIYTPNETHPWNHFSTETTAYMIDFYNEAFSFQLEKANLDNDFLYEAKGGQTWWLKEGFEFIAMIALFVAVIPAMDLLLKVPFFAKVKTDEKELPVEKKTSKGKKVALLVTALITALIPAFYFPTFIKQTDANLSIFTRAAEGIMYICMLLSVAVWVAYFVIKMVKGEQDDSKIKGTAWAVTKGSIIVSACALFVRYLAVNHGTVIKMGHQYNAPTSNSIAFWAIISGAIALLVLSIVHHVAKKNDGATVKSYGLAANIKQILLALLISLILFVGIYLVVFLIGWIFNTDFRLWVYAIKSFKWHHFTSFLRYVPLFFIYYFINSIIITANTKDVKGWKGYLYALGLNIGGLVLLVIYQYGKLFVTGMAAVPTLALEAILLFGLIPSLAIAAIFAKKMYEKTNNIWTSAFFNTFLFTMIMIANTTVYLLAK